MSFKRHLHCGNPSLFSGPTVVQSRPKSHTFTVNRVYRPKKMASKTVVGSFMVKSSCGLDKISGIFLAKKTTSKDSCFVRGFLIFFCRLSNSFHLKLSNM